MNWEAIGAVGEVLGAVAVVATLAYLSAQIRSGNRALLASQREAGFTAIREWNHQVMVDEQLADVIRRGAKDLSSLTPTEEVQFGTCFYAFFKAFENIYLQCESGNASIDIWEGHSEGLLLYLRQPGVRAWLEKGTRLLDKRFARVLLEDNSLHAHGDADPDPSMPQLPTSDMPTGSTT